MQRKADKQDEADLGMAANSVLQSIPLHVLKALEQQQTEANEINAESKVSTSCLRKLDLHVQRCGLELSKMTVTAGLRKNKVAPSGGGGGMVRGVGGGSDGARTSQSYCLLCSLHFLKELQIDSQHRCHPQHPCVVVPAKSLGNIAVACQNYAVLQLSTFNRRRS